MDESRFDSLRKELEKLAWPEVYMFKFIIPSDKRKLALVSALFPDEAEVTIKESSKGNYIAFTARELMMNADRVIARYQSAYEIEGIIAL